MDEPDRVHVGAGPVEYLLNKDDAMR